MRGRGLATAGWLVGTLAVLIASGGAASTPGGWLLGAPSWTAGIAALAVLGAAAAVLGWDAGRWLLGAAPFVLLVIAGVRVPGVAALAGPPLAVLVIAGLALAIAASPPRWSAAAFLPVVALVYGIAAARVQAQVGAEGDEPHYLMVADSLLRDHDLSLERDYAEGRYLPFHPAPLLPHYRVRGRGGAIYSLHAVGLSLLILPAYAAAGYAGASFFMALLAAGLAAEVRGLLRAWIGEGADGTAWIVAVSPPLVHYAGLVFTEVPAALIVAAALRRGRDTVSPRTAVAMGAAVAFLPWLNVRYAILTVVLLAFVLAARPRAPVALSWVAPSLLSAALLALHHYRLYGFFDPRRVYGRNPELALGGLVTGLPGLFFDQEFGLLAYAPVFALAAFGLVALWKRSPRLTLTVIALALAVVAVAGAWPMWRGGFNPPARFLVPILPALALALAARLRGGLSAGAALLVAWGLWTGAIGAWDRPLVHRDRDGTAPLLRAASGAEEWTRLLPGFVLEDSAADRARLTAIWAAALLAAGVLARPGWRGTPGGLAVASLGFLLATAVASRSSRARTEGRDGVRVVGRPALAVPGWSPCRAAPGTWTIADLGWGPTYEPHRAPEGALLGGRLPLPPGLYGLTLEGEAVPSALPPAYLVSGPEGGPTISAPLALSSAGLTGTFAVAGGGPTTLRLRSGAPFIVKDIRIERASTFSGPAGLSQ
jgi:hypothetical protein